MPALELTVVPWSFCAISRDVAGLMADLVLREDESSKFDVMPPLKSVLAFMSTPAHFVLGIASSPSSGYRPPRKPTP
jgi:hypothetical protein